jgi:pilus assembly protein CpaE
MTGQEKIRVIIVDDIAETRENIKRMMQFDQNIEVVGVARTAQEAIDLCQQLKPDVAIMDINMPDIDGITATEIIRKKVPQVQVIILSVQSDQNYMRNAMKAGARDFLSKPPMIDELTSAIRRAGAVAQEEKSKFYSTIQAGVASGSTQTLSGMSTSGKVLVAYSPKGGVGTTTIATNLAFALQNPNCRVLLIDGNLQFGDVAVFINEQGKNSLIDLLPSIDELDTELITDVIITHQATGLHILAAPARPELAAQVNGEQFNKLLTFLKRLYNYIVIDTTSILTDIVQASIDTADFILLITNQEIPALKNCHQFLSLADAGGISRDRILFIMNKWDKRIAITPEKIGESLKQKVVNSIPYDERTPLLAVNRGIPFMVDNKTLPISRSIVSLAELIIEKCKELEEPFEVKRGLRK